MRRPTILDELLDAVGDVKVAFVVDVKDIARFEPSVLGEGFLLKIRAFPVTAEDVWSFDEEFARLCTS